MKRIAIDISYYGKMSGYGVVTNNLLKRILEKDKENYFYLVSNEKKDLSELRDLKNWEFVCTNTSFLKHKFFILPKYLKKYNIDIYFSFDQDLPLRKVCKYAIISHDIGGIVLGKKRLFNQIRKGLDLKNGLYHLLGLEKRACKKADLIFCPSENSKKDLIREFGISESKIHVSYWGLNHLKKLKNPRKENYILFPFSNLYGDFQYDLANKILEENLTDKIYFLRPAYISSIIKLNPKINIIKNRISQEELISYYEKAKFSIYLSDYDGFGFPPLESIFYGTPVLCNNCSCLPEVLNGIGIIDSLNINKFIKSIKNSSNLLSQQEKILEKYDWKKTASLVLSYLTKC